MSNLIREATIEDIPQILQIVHDAFAKYARDLPLEAKVSALSEDAAILEKEMSIKRVLVSVGEDGQINGTIRYQILPGNMGYISRFGVSSGRQKNGVGRDLMKVVVAECIRKEVNALALHTCSTMRPLIRFYYGQGFYIHSTRFDRGYIRALLLHDLKKNVNYNLDFVINL